MYHQYVFYILNLKVSKGLLNDLSKYHFNTEYIVIL